MVKFALLAAEKLSKGGISVEVVDPRTIVPLDMETLLKSVQKTKRVLVVTEEVKSSGFGGEIVARIAEDEISMHLLKPVKRMGGKFTPMPAGKALEAKQVPSVEEIEEEIKKLMETL
jgi:pyruvate dehydrogenase E1 component beta subunit